MSSINRFRFVLFVILTLGIIMPMTNPSEEKHKQIYYASLKKSDSTLSPFVHAAGKFADGIENIFGKNPVFVYEDRLFYSSLKMNTNNIPNDDEDTILTLGILGNVFTLPWVR